MRQRTNGKTKRLISIALIIALTLLLWAIFALRGSPLTGCLMLLGIGSCFGRDFIAFPIGGVTLTLDRLALVGLVAAYGVQRRLGRTDPKPVGAADLVLAALLVVLTLSTLVNGWRAAAVDPTPPWWRLTAGYLWPATVYWMARQSRLSEGAARLTLLSLTGVAVYLAATGVLEVYQQWWLVFPRYIADPALGRHFGRARGPMLQSVSYGVYVTIGMLSAWLWRLQLGRVGRTLVCLLFPLFLAGVFFSYTRSVWFGAALGSWVVCALTLPRLWHKFAAGVVIAGLLVAAFSWQGGATHFERATDTATDTSASASDRLAFAYVSWRMFLDRPWFGVGFGHFAEAKLRYLDNAPAWLPLEPIRRLAPHGTLLTLPAETGLVGAGLFVAMLTCWTWTAWCLWSGPRAPAWPRAQGALLLGALAVYVCQWCVHELSYAPIDHGLLFMLAGIAVGVRARSPESAVLAIG